MGEQHQSIKPKKMQFLDLPNVLGHDAQIMEIIQNLPKIAETEANVFLHGERGTGKELIARSIHSQSRRYTGPFVPVNCVTLQHDLAELDLLGSENGNAASTRKSKIGFLELAQNGTLFLEEVCGLGLDVQAKLLRILRDGRFKRIGGSENIVVNVRIISTMVKDPLAAIKNQSLRNDLFYRLSIIPLRIPPLKDRPDDIELLATQFISKFASNIENPPIEFTSEALRYLRRYSWPGNIRELESVIENVVYMTKKSKIELNDLPDSIHRQMAVHENLETESGRSRSSTSNLPLREARQQWIEKFEREYLIDLLNRYNGNISRVAREAGVHRMTIYRMLKNYDITIAPRRAQ